MASVYSGCPCGGFFRIPTLSDCIIGSIQCSRDPEHTYHLDDFVRRIAVDEFVEKIEAQQKEDEEL